MATLEAAFLRSRTVAHLYVHADQSVAFHRTYQQPAILLATGPKGPNDPFELTLSLPGFLEVGVAVTKFPLSRDIYIQDVKAACGNAPVGAAAVFNLQLMGTDLFTAAKPTVPDGQLVGPNVVPTTTFCPAGAYLQVEVEQIGSSYPGYSATLVIRHY